MPIKLEDLIPGGKSDNMTLAQIAKKHGVSISDIQKEFELGMKVEREHSDNPEKKKEVAMDHLFENPKYYTKLKKAGLVDESRVGDMYIEIGETIEGIEEATKKLISISSQMAEKDVVKILKQEILPAITSIKGYFGDSYDFGEY